MNWSTGATLGALIIGVGLVILNIGTWWPGLKVLKKDAFHQSLFLLPFVFGFCFGVLAILCAGGLLGWAANVVLWGGSWVGDGALIWGVGGMREDVSRGPAQALTNGGHAVVLILLFVVAVVRKRAKSAKKAIGQGICSGVFLGTIQGVAGVMAIPLASAVNIAGAWMSTGVLH